MNITVHTSYLSDIEEKASDNLSLQIAQHMQEQGSIDVYLLICREG